MRTDQFEKLQSLGEKLTDVVLIDSDPDNWVGKGLNPDQLTQEQRGDAYWCRKMAVASLAVLTRIAHLVGIVQEQSRAGLGAVAVTEGDNLLDDEVKAAEKEGKQLLEKLHQRQLEKSKVAKKVHGKP